MRAFAALLVAALTLALPAATPAKLAPATAAPMRDSAEVLLDKTVEDIAHQHFDAALGQVDDLIRLQPNFRLAHLIKGDILLAKVRPLETLGAAAGPLGRLTDLREEAVARLRALRERPGPDQVPSYLLKLRPEDRYAIVVDIGRSRLYFYKNAAGIPRLVTDYYVSSGKAGALKTREGDMRTPIGVYHVTARLPKAKLPDLYGAGAFPISYPNEWDRHLGRNGYGIWLHGTPSNTYSRAPRASDGCVVLSNADLKALAPDMQIGVTPVIISEHVRWEAPAAIKAERRSFLATLDRWRTDWESRDTARYLSHYSRRFASATGNFRAWRAHKLRVNAGKRWIRVRLSDISVLRDPGEKAMMVVSFEQDYQSNNLSNVMRKRQYWRKEGGRWKIVYEGAA